MATEPHEMKHDSVEMPEPTVAPLVLSLGMAMLAFGFVGGTAFLLVGGVMLLFGLGMWISNLLPGRGHMHEPLAEPDNRPKPIAAVLGRVQELRAGMPGYRVRLPEKVHPISAGIKGGLAGGLIIPLPALLWGLFSGKGIWYPMNLLAGMALPLKPEGDLEKYLQEFHFTLLIVAVVIHFITCLIIGMVYGVLLPTLPPIPQAMAWGALLAPIVWSGATYLFMCVVNPGLREGVNWPWFIVSQFIYGVVMTLVVTQATDLKPVIRGAVGGLLGGMLMPIPAILWSLSEGNGFFYPINLLAGVVVPDLDPKSSVLRQFQLDWFIFASVVHGLFSIGFGVACALLIPKLQAIPGPFAWGALLLPMLWTGASYGLMGVVNPVLQQKVSWPWFIVSQFIFGIVAAIIVMRSEQIEVPPAGRGKG